MMISEVLAGFGNRLTVCLYKGTFRGDLTGPNPTDRGKRGTKRHLLTDKNGMPPLSMLSSQQLIHMI